MAKAVNVDAVLKALPHLLTLPSRSFWVDYDEEADVLYVSFEKPQNADNSVLENEAIINYRNGKVVGITVLDASKHKQTITDLPLVPRFRGTC